MRIEENSSGEMIAWIDGSSKRVGCPIYDTRKYNYERTARSLDYRGLCEMMALLVIVGDTFNAKETIKTYKLKKLEERLLEE